MSLEALEKLEKLIAAYVSETHKLQSENRHLSREIERLQSEVRAAAGKHDAAREKLQRLAFLEGERRKAENDKHLVRAKVKGMLEDLEKVEFI